jgi:hypothetical protein
MRQLQVRVVQITNTSALPFVDTTCIALSEMLHSRKVCHCSYIKATQGMRRFSFYRYLDESMILPEPKAVMLQAKTCLYVTSLALEAPSAAPSAIREKHLKFGWCKGADDRIMIDWGVAQNQGQGGGMTGTARRTPVAALTQSSWGRRQAHRTSGSSTKAASIRGGRTSTGQLRLYQR